MVRSPFGDPVRPAVVKDEPASRSQHEREGIEVATNPHTGQKAPTSGIYKPTNGGKEIAVSKGDTLPPAKGQGTGYKLVRPTK